MNRTSLEFMVNIEADESTLKSIKNALTEVNSGLIEAVVKAIKANINEAGITDNLTINLPPHCITIKTSFKGGLSAQEWLETGNLSDQVPSGRQGVSGFYD